MYILSFKSMRDNTTVYFFFLEFESFTISFTYSFRGDGGKIQTLATYLWDTYANLSITSFVSYVNRNF